MNHNFSSPKQLNQNSKYFKKVVNLVRFNSYIINRHWFIRKANNLFIIQQIYLTNNKKKM